MTNETWITVSEIIKWTSIKCSEKKTVVNFLLFAFVVFELNVWVFESRWKTGEK